MGHVDLSGQVDRVVVLAQVGQVDQGLTSAVFVLRDADETKEWVEEKNQALNTDNYGHDLASVQALQRKHEGFERDLAALGDKV